MKFEELNERNSTIVIWEGMELRTTQDPYITLNQFSETCYVAPAINERNKGYIIFWEITNPEAENEEDACDWDNPITVMQAPYFDVED